jgi:peptidoglycan/xylan/chitin deacetylase (PgdA/CDA1 family)
MARHIVCITFDHDHLSGFIARGLTTPTAISRGEYDIVVIPRLVALLGKYGIKATFFTPGHTIDSTPQAIMPYVEAGHELAITAGRIACRSPSRAKRRKRRSSAATTPSSA